MPFGGCSSTQVDQTNFVEKVEFRVKIWKSTSVEHLKWVNMVGDTPSVAYER